MRLSPNYHGLLPDVGNLKSKSRQHRIAVDGGWIFEDLNRLVRTVDIDVFLEWINEPAELSAVVDVFGHLRLQHPESHRPSVARRHQFDDEVRTKRWNLFLLLIREGPVPSTASLTLS